MNRLNRLVFKRKKKIKETTQSKGIRSKPDTGNRNPLRLKVVYAIGYIVSKKKKKFLCKLFNTSDTTGSKVEFKEDDLYDLEFR